MAGSGKKGVIEGIRKDKFSDGTKRWFVRVETQRDRYSKIVELFDLSDPQRAKDLLNGIAKGKIKFDADDGKIVAYAANAVANYAKGARTFGRKVAAQNAVIKICKMYTRSSSFRKYANAEVSKQLGLGTMTKGSRLAKAYEHARKAQ